MKNALNHVQLHDKYITVMGCRRGTVLISLDTMRELFGPEQSDGDGDKVTACWTFNTPRGFIEVRDYWWNGREECSIAGTSYRAAMWIAAYFRARGYKASTYTAGYAMRESRWLQ